VVKIWDIFRATEDAHTANLARLDSAIMSGAYSPDFSRLVLGEVNKSITLLDVGQSGDGEVGEFKELHPPEGADALAGAMDLCVASTSNDQRTQAPTVRNGSGWSVTLPLRRQLGIRAVDESARAIDALSQARIPANLRVVDEYAPPRARAVAAPDAATRPCRGCGASMRARESQDGAAWCQRCRFGCFRCGRLVRVPFPYDVVECRDCGLAWSVGAAGYDVVRKDRMDVDGEACPPRVEREKGWDGELAEHYHALWGAGEPETA
jgi:DNA-directed RNA polymerase subunit RPC12/RpoP